MCAAVILTACIGDRSTITQAQYVDISGHEVSVLVADSPEERRQGLTGQDQVPGGADGMLFVYDEPTNVTYGMLGVPVPLDIWFFDETGELIGGTEMEPCPSEPCTSYASPGPVQWVLETPAGVFDFEQGAVLTGAPE